MTARENALGKLDDGDLFDAEDAAGPTRICMVMSITKTTIVARSITVQETIEFDRLTGAAKPPFDFVITSVAALPRDIHDIFLGLDRKYREARANVAKDPNWVPPTGHFALTEDQKRAFLLSHDFYKQNPLPPA
jgi:hypothetical protein